MGIYTHTRHAMPNSWKCPVFGKLPDGLLEKTTHKLQNTY